MVRPWVHRLAVATAAATVFLLFVGAIVTSKGVGLAVPDWPTTFGHNMFLFPWARMVGGVFYEHSHRLVASGVGLLTVLLALALWLQESRRWLHWLGTLALVLVIVQGVVGGLRVVFIEQWFAVVHAALAQAFFGLIVAISLFTSKRWRSTVERLPDPGNVRRVCVLTTLLIYAQAILGALIRHTGLAIELHILVAAGVAVHVFLLVRRTEPVGAAALGLRRAALWLGGLTVLQLALGTGSYLARFSGMAPHWSTDATVALTAAHVVVGSLMFALGLVLTLLAFRLLEQKEQVAGNVAFPRRASA